VTARAVSGQVRFPPAFGGRAVVIAVIVIVVLAVTGQRVGVPQMAGMTADAGLAAIGAKAHSQVLSGLAGMLAAMWPPQIEQRTEVARIEAFDPGHLPPFSHVESVATSSQSLNPETLQIETKRETQEILVEPIGYLALVLFKMVETMEIALWGTVLAVLASLPVAILAARNYSPHPAVYLAARSVAGFLRSIPEIFGALILVLGYGFGPIPGVLALALHSTGFLAKFFAEDIETAAPGPQDALRAIGAGPLKRLRVAVLPEVLPQYVAYTAYVLDRNVRMATVIGVVGAGGIGQELKGRFDLYDYAHVGTILIVIFIAVMLLDQASAGLRRRLIGRPVTT
jgi:phosphonate transport system permease protein